MTDKIIFWLSADLLPYCLSYYFQKKFNGELFAIYDLTNKPKEFFKKQNFVDFSKIWFYHDHISTKNKNNLTYLQEINKKYNLDLNELAKNDRILNKYNEYFNFSDNEINSILESECKLFENILDEIKPDYIILNEPPFHHQKLIMELCRARGIKILCLCISRFEASTIIVENNATFDLPQNLDLIKLNELGASELKVKEKGINYNKSNLRWAKDRKFSTLGKLRALIDYILFSDSKNIKTNYTYYGRKKYKVILDTVLFYIRRQKRYRYLQINSKKIVDLHIPFVYFPLALDDDQALLNDAPLFTNQIEVIKHIAKSIPINYQLYVKDHFFAGFRGWKEIKQYQEIKELPNVTLIHPTYPSKELIKNCNIVISVRGSSSLEAAYENKPSIIFDNIPHDILPSVYKVKSITELPKLIKTALNTPIDSAYIKKYDELIRKRIIDFNWSDMEILRNEQFYSGNILSDVEYPESKVKEFFEDNKIMFQKLADAHLKKINL